MSAVLADLDLPQTQARPYNLWLSLGLLSGHLTAIATVNHCVVMSAGDERAELAESFSLGHVLKIGTARFKLLPEEVDSVRTFLAQFPSPASPSSDAAHEATTTAARSPYCDDGGTPPPRFSSFGGHSEASLDHENATFAQALTCNEGY